jgi:phenylacetic acid degradation operon negative regulatory protein
MARRSDDLVAELLDRLKPRAKSLIVTLYGDAISHHGGKAWLGSVIALAARLGLSERAVRTSVFRLAKEGWLVPLAVGRRSEYRLTEVGQRRIDAVHERLYSHAQRPWDRGWTIVATGAGELDAETRDALHRDLGWLGFGQLAPGVMLHPDPDERALRQLLDAAGPRVLVIRGPAAPWLAPQAQADVLRVGWDIDRLAADYSEFLEIFRPAWQALRDATHPDPALCFSVRTLVMHGYRRAILRDPLLPEELLPHNWPGTAARALCRNLYRLVEAGAERHVMATLETAEGPVPQAHPSYFTRFGGVRSQADQAGSRPARGSSVSR